MTPYAITPREVFHDRKLSANAKALCGLISTYETVENKRWITLKQSEIADILSITRETVNRLVKQLVTRGHLETRNATTSARGRVSLMYRVRHDLPEDADVVIQALGAGEKKDKETADVTLTSHENADVTPGSQPSPKQQADVTPASQQPPPDVFPTSPHIGPDVTPTSLPYSELNTLSTETDTNSSLFFVEGAVPKRRSRALLAEVGRVAEAMWQTWPPVARKRHTRQEVADAVEAELRKGVARGDDLVAAGKRHVAERLESGAGYVKGLVPFLKKGLWQNWTEDDAPYAAPVETAEWRRRVANFDHDGSWAASYGPKPNEPGYLGPPASKPQSRDQDHRSAA